MFTKDLFNELKQFVDLHLIVANETIPLMEASPLPKENQCDSSHKILKHENHCFDKDNAPVFEHELSDFVKNTKRPAFSEMLLRYIDKLGISDADVYKRAGIDRRHFSKIRSNPEYHPGKNTAIALALALSLERAEIDTLIGAAGYTLSDSDKFDLVITFCVNKKIYALDDVNAALDYFSLKPLTGVS